MAGPGKPAPLQPRRPDPRGAGSGATPPRRPPQVVLLKKDEPKDAGSPAAPSATANLAGAPAPAPAPRPPAPASAPAPAPTKPTAGPSSDEERFSLAELDGLTMADLLGPAPGAARRGDPARSAPRPAGLERSPGRTVDDFDFDEEAFLAALDHNEPIGTTGDVVKGQVIGVESDGVYVDIGGKAPGFMPKRECGLGVITNLKERFPKDLPVEVLVTREQNAEGMVTVSVRALELRQSWDRVMRLEKEGTVVQVKVNGFNRGGVTCDLEGLRGFIPRSQLNEGEQHEALVGKTLAAAFLEVNPETRKLVLSEKKAATLARFSELAVGQLVEGQVNALKPYGFFVDLGGVSGLLHHSAITGAVLRDLREAFQPGERIHALVMEVDGQRGRIALNTALLENQPGELLIAKEQVMAEASERAARARSMLQQRMEASLAARAQAGDQAGGPSGDQAPDPAGDQAPDPAGETAPEAPAAIDGSGTP
ncbi:MAG: S1 RNA-binding domain-containing protein [Cyanobacteriota bacterium]|nr:S1 RNA-binding domain-containing protein [Cyanobacteriota bacterium]